MVKSEYLIDGRTFHVERSGRVWTGWYLDEPSKRFSGRLKADVLYEAGYRMPGNWVTYKLSADGSVEVRRGRPQGMKEAYANYRAKLAKGHRPKIRDDQPLGKFVIFARDEFHCLYCGKVVEMPALDHVRPVNAGGTHEAGNLATACRSCNSRKGHSRLPDESDRLAEVSRRNAAYRIRDSHIVYEATIPRASEIEKAMAEGRPLPVWPERPK